MIFNVCVCLYVFIMYVCIKHVYPIRNFLIIADAPPSINTIIVPIIRYSKSHQVSSDISLFSSDSIGYLNKYFVILG